MSSKERSRVFAAFDQWGFNEKGWSPRTRSNYYRTAIRTDKWLVANRDTNLIAATAQDLKACIFALPPNARSRNATRQGLVAFGNFMVSIGLAESNQALAISRLPEPRPIPKALTHKEALRIRAAAKLCGLQMETLVAVFLYAGLRVTEARTLEWRNVDLEAGYIRFWAKRAKERSLPLHKAARALLVAWKAACPSLAYVFPSPLDPQRPMSDAHLREQLWEVGRNAGVHLYPHLLRHTAATRLLDTGADIVTVKEYLGHASIHTTQIYLRVRNPKVQEAVGRLDF